MERNQCQKLNHFRCVVALANVVETLAGDATDFDSSAAVSISVDTFAVGSIFLINERIVVSVVPFSVETFTVGCMLSVNICLFVFVAVVSLSDDTFVLSCVLLLN